VVASAVHLTAVTSIPVINKLFNTKRAPVGIDHYNQVQTFFALAICALVAVVQFMRYRQDKKGKFWSNILRSLIISVVIVIVALLVFDEFKKPEYILVILTSLFAVLANMDYVIKFVKKNWKLSGPSIAHIGFAMVILGAVISAGHKKIISANNNGINLEMLNSEFKNNENIMLHLHDTVEMGPYHLTFVNDTLIENIAYYQIDYLKKDNGNYKKAFTLFPKLITSAGNMGNVPEPSTKHYLLKDIFTHVTYVDMERINRLKNPQMANMQKEKEIQHFKLEKGDTIFGTRYYIVFEGLEAASDISHVDESQPLSLTLRGSFIIRDMKGDVDTIHPIYDIKNNMVSTEKDMSEKFGIEVELEKILEKHVEINMREVRMENNRFIIMQAIIFPGINILWVGCFLMVIGTFFAVIRRITQTRRNRDHEHPSQ
jgi:cytochrome c-type biogenesis protein CcmF